MHQHPTAKAMGVMVPTPCDLRVTCGGCTAQGSRGAAALTQIFGGAAGRVRHCHSGTEAARQGKAATPTNVVTGKRFRSATLDECDRIASNSRSRLTISETVKKFRT